MFWNVWAFLHRQRRRGERITVEASLGYLAALGIPRPRHEEYLLMIAELDEELFAWAKQREDEESEQRRRSSGSRS